VAYILCFGLCVLFFFVAFSIGRVDGRGVVAHRLVVVLILDNFALEEMAMEKGAFMAFPQ